MAFAGIVDPEGGGKSDPTPGGGASELAKRGSTPRRAAVGSGAAAFRAYAPAAVTTKSVAKPSSTPASTSHITRFVCPYRRLTANSSCTT